MNRLKRFSLVAYAFAVMCLVGVGQASAQTGNPATVTDIDVDATAMVTDLGTKYGTLIATCLALGFACMIAWKALRAGRRALA